MMVVVVIVAAAAAAVVLVAAIQDLFLLETNYCVLIDYWSDYVDYEIYHDWHFYFDHVIRSFCEFYFVMEVSAVGLEILIDDQLDFLDPDLRI